MARTQAVSHTPGMSGSGSTSMIKSMAPGQLSTSAIDYDGKPNMKHSFSTTTLTGLK